MKKYIKIKPKHKSNKEKAKLLKKVANYYVNKDEFVEDCKILLKLHEKFYFIYGIDFKIDKK